MDTLIEESARRVAALRSASDLNGSIFYNGEFIEIPKHSLGVWLSKLPKPDGNIVVNDTEASGLFSDGNWSTTQKECSPPARVSIQAYAYKRADNGEFVYFAIPFDQGMIGGKDGAWNYERDCFDILPHIDTCQIDGAGYGCTCAPWNFDEHAWRELMLWMSDKRLVFHNAKYDLHVNTDGLRYAPGSGFDFQRQFHWDTLLVQAVAEPLHSNALDDIGKRVFGMGKTVEMETALKAQGTALSYRYDLVHWSIAGRYAAQDCLLTIMLYYRQVSMIEDGTIDADELWIIEKREFPKMRLLYNMELRGVGYAVDEMRDEAVKMDAAVTELRGKLPWVAEGLPATVNGAKSWFFDRLNIVPVKLGNSCSVCGYNIETGKRRKKKVPQCAAGEHQLAPSLDAEVVARLVEQQVNGADEYQHISNLESALSKWYHSWPRKVGADGRLRCNFRQCHTESDRKDRKSGGAISNRLSAERVQFQGFPKDTKLPKDIKTPKKMIRAKAGHQVWEIDVSNAEIRVAAWASRDTNLIAKVNSGKNIHDENTVAIFGHIIRAQIDGWLDEWIDDVSKYETHPQWDDYRNMSKIGVFSDFYGSGVDTMLSQFQSGLKRTLPRNMVTDFKANLAKAYPGVKRASRQAQRKADVGMGGCGYIRLYNGRRRWFGWGERTHKAWNQVMQCNVAEAVTEWMLEVDKHYPGILINQVHDSLWLEVPEGTAEAIVDHCMEIGVKVFERAFTGIMFKIDKKRLA